MMKATATKVPKPFSDISLASYRILAAYSAAEDCPSYTEIARKLGKSRNAIAKQVKILERKGYVELRPGHRNVVLTDRAL